MLGVRWGSLAKFPNFKPPTWSFAPPIGLEPITLRFDLDVLDLRWHLLIEQVVDRLGGWDETTGLGRSWPYWVHKGCTLTPGGPSMRRASRCPCGPWRLTKGHTGGDRRTGWSRSSLKASPTAGPAHTTKAMVPAPIGPPRIHPNDNPAASEIPRATPIGTRPRTCTATISPSRGPGPRCAPTYVAHPTTNTTMPRSRTVARTTTAASPTSSSQGEASSTLRTAPIVTTLSTVPTPGRTPATATITTSAAPITIEAVPTPMPTFAARPMCRTSQGATPSRAWIVSQIPTELIASPIRSCTVRPGLRMGHLISPTTAPTSPAVR